MDKSSGDEDAGVDAQEGAGWREVGSVCAEREIWRRSLACSRTSRARVRVAAESEGTEGCGFLARSAGGDGNPRDKT